MEPVRQVSAEEFMDFVLKAQEDKDRLFMVRESSLCPACRERFSRTTGALRSAALKDEES